MREATDNGSTNPRTVGIEQANEALREYFGYPAFRAGQSRAIASVLAGRDAMVVLPTGGGKSLCYQVPALILPQLTVVISPLISLMKDQVDALTRRGIPATFLNGTLTSAQIREELARARDGSVRMLYVAPERFDVGNTAEQLRQSGVSLLAIDEAHCISEWGHDFRPSYLRLAAVRERLGSPVTIALTATATPRVRSDIVRQLRLESPETVVTGFDRTNLSYYVVPAPTEADKDRALVALLRQRPGLAVVYASTRRAVERIAGVLSAAKIRSAAYHAGLEDADRQEVQDAFMKERVRAIVATNAFGMGIDKPNVRLVIHHAMPGTLEAYYQEAGRAGRDGLPGECFLLYAYPDRFTHEFFIKGTYPERALVEAVYAVLQQAAAPSGAVPANAAAIAAQIKSKPGPREVEAALRVLESVDAFVDDKRASALVTVRLLATPERITRELGPAAVLELRLLRALWRATGGAVQNGECVDLDQLPCECGGVTGAQRLLNALQARQFVQWSPAHPSTRLTRAQQPLSAFRIDWASMDRRRQADLAKLDAVQQYAYLKQCRRAFVLRYFGDQRASTTCAGCDNCIGVHFTTKALARREPVRGTEPAR